MAQTKLIHLVGRQASGKTTRGRQLAEALRAQGLIVRFPQEEDAYTDAEIARVVQQRNCRYLPEAHKNPTPDVIIIEHAGMLPPTVRLERHDEVVHMDNPHRQTNSLSILVRGLRIEAKCVEGDVVHLAVRANEQDESLWGRLRQHLANALFRAADACHPGQDNGPMWVVERMVGCTALENLLANRAEDGTRYIWPRHDALGNAYYQTLAIYEGVKRHQDGRPVSKRWLRLRGQKRADYSHVDPSLLKGAIVDHEGGAA